MKKLITALLLLGGVALAEPPQAVAIRNARIVTVSGPAIAKGTVVLRNGLIEAVGENVAVPADAWMVDGEGMTVYPGLVDAMSTIGIPSLAQAAAGATGGRGAGRGQAGAQSTPAPRSMGPEDRPQTTSWVLAADEIQPGDPRIAAARNEGFTTALTFPQRGIFGGQGSAIDLGDSEKAGELVVAPALGQWISVGRGGFGFGGGFPSALMGYIAYIRQLYLDADHYRLLKEAYAKDPRGMARPEYDRALEGVLASQRILLPANRVVEMDRMLRFAAELKQPVILYGMREGYRPGAADLVRKYNAPVLVSLRWSEPPRDPNPEQEQSLRSLEDIDLGPSTPALLKKAGVPFAFYADGLDQPRDLQRAIKRAMQAGLSREDAIRALTLAPAEIYNLADRLGSIEKGKIANLVVTKGELFDDNTRIQMVFVDGRQYKPAPETPAGGRGGMMSAPGVEK
jgi:hypothetical protein